MMKDLKHSYHLNDTLEVAKVAITNSIEYMQELLEHMEYIEGLNDWDLTHALMHEELNIQDLELAIEDAQQAMECLEIAQDFVEEQQQAMEESNE